MIDKGDYGWFLKWSECDTFLPLFPQPRFTIFEMKMQKCTATHME